MSAAIMVSFIIPAIVTVMLIGLMIKERDYLFPKKAGEDWLKKLWMKIHGDDKIEERTTKEETKRDNFWDLSGGSLGIW